LYWQDFIACLKIYGKRKRKRKRTVIGSLERRD